MIDKNTFKNHFSLVKAIVVSTEDPDSLGRIVVFHRYAPFEQGGAVELLEGRAVLVAADLLHHRTVDPAVDGRHHVAYDMGSHLFSCLYLSVVASVVRSACPGGRVLCSLALV